MPPIVTDALGQWFAREILAHERALTRYLLRVWPHRDEVPDLRQEIYVRVFEAAADSLPRWPKSFLFTTARHLMTDSLRRRRVIFIGACGDLDALNVLVDEMSPERHVTGLEQLTRLAQAFDALPPKCRSVMWLRKVKQLSQKAAAERLGVKEKTVEMHLARGMQILLARMRSLTEQGHIESDAVDEAQGEHERG